MRWIFTKENNLPITLPPQLSVALSHEASSPGVGKQSDSGPGLKASGGQWVTLVVSMGTSAVHAHSLLKKVSFRGLELPPGAPWRADTL